MFFSPPEQERDDCRGGRRRWGAAFTDEAHARRNTSCRHRRSMRMYFWQCRASYQNDADMKSIRLLPAMPRVHLLLLVGFIIRHHHENIARAKCPRAIWPNKQYRDAPHVLSLGHRYIARMKNIAFTIAATGRERHRYAAGRAKPMICMKYFLMTCRAIGDIVHENARREIGPM